MALALGCPDVDGMLDRMDGDVFDEWVEFYRRHPWGEERADLRAGIVASTMANLWTKGKRWRPDQFMPFRKPREQTVDEMKAVVRAFTAANLGAMKRGKV